jgi:hypothetical protein
MRNADLYVRLSALVAPSSLDARCADASTGVRAPLDTKGVGSSSGAGPTLFPVLPVDAVRMGVFR